MSVGHAFLVAVLAGLLLESWLNAHALAVGTGYVLTDLIRNQLDATSKARGIPKEQVIRDVLLADQPTKRFVKVEEVAALVRHLCSDDAASITGACLSIDGGWTAR